MNTDSSGGHILLADWSGTRLYRDVRRYHRCLIPLVALVILCFGILIGGARLQAMPFSDEAYYMVVAKSINGGSGIRVISSPEAPPAAVSTPGYPVVLAGLVELFGLSSAVPYRALTMLLWGASIVAVYVVIGQHDGPGWAWLITVLFALNVYVMMYSTSILTDIPYLAVSLLLIACTHHYLHSDRSPRRLLLGCCIVLLCTYLVYLRLVGISLILAIAISLAVVRKDPWAALAALILVGLAFAPWLIWSQASGGESSLAQLTVANPYNPELKEPMPGALLDRAVANVKFYSASSASAIRRLVLAENYCQILPVLRHPYISASLGIVVTLVVVLGWKAKFKLRESSIVEWYVLLYLLILFVWPYRDLRFLLPIAPFLLWFFLTGVAVITGYVGSLLHWEPLRQKQFFQYIWFALLCSALAGSIIGAYSHLPMMLGAESSNGRAVDAYLEAATWLKDNTPPEAVVLARKTDSLYLISNRHAVRYPFTTDFGAMASFFLAHDVSYVVLDSLGYGDEQRFLIPFIENNENAFEELYGTKDGLARVLRFHPQGLGQ